MQIFQVATRTKVRLLPCIHSHYAQLTNRKTHVPNHSCNKSWLLINTRHKSLLSWITAVTYHSCHKSQLSQSTAATNHSCYPSRLQQITGIANHSSHKLVIRDSCHKSQLSQITSHASQLSQITSIQIVILFAIQCWQRNCIPITFVQWSLSWDWKRLSRCEYRNNF